MADFVTAEQILDSAELLAPGAKLGCKLTGNAVICAISNVLERLSALDTDTRQKVADYLRWLPLVGAVEGAEIEPEPTLPAELADLQADLATMRDALRESSTAEE